MKQAWGMIFVSLVIIGGALWYTFRRAKGKSGGGLPPAHP